MEIEKTDSSADGLDLAQLMNQIRNDAAERKRNSLKNGISVFYQQLLTQAFDVRLPSFSSDDPLLPELRLQPAFEKREQYELNDLLGFHDAEFVRNAYRAILKREPDDHGFPQFLGKLRSGRYSKIDILASLKFSPEGRNANVRIEGLGRLSLLRKVYRVPVFGYFLQLAVAIVRLPVLIANHRRLETHTAAQLERVASHLNETITEFSEANRKQVEVSRIHFDTIHDQLNDLKNGFRVQIDSLIDEHGKMLQSQNAIKQSHSAFQADINSRLDQTNEYARELNEYARGLPERHAADLQALKLRLEEQVDDVIQRLQHTRMDIVQQQTRLSHFLDSDYKPLPQLAEQKQGPQSEEDHLLDSLYFSLEDVLRGTPDEIKKEVKVYLPVLKNAGVTSGILDVGCGRGEWLEVLRQEGFQARGIDQNRIVIEQCRALSLDVVEGEALSYLRSLADGSLNAITAFHFAEHLPFKTLVAFLDEAGRTLKPGGLLILETPNPENLLVGSCNFYLDPTHKNPIPIPTMRLLVEARGFRCQEVMKLHPVSSTPIEVKDQLTSHLNHYLYGPMNYAVVARKPGSDTP